MIDPETPHCPPRSEPGSAFAWWLFIVIVALLTFVIEQLASLVGVLF